MQDLYKVDQHQNIHLGMDRTDHCGGGVRIGVWVGRDLLRADGGLNCINTDTKKIPQLRLDERLNNAKENFCILGELTSCM